MSWARAYHQATKYDPETIGQHPGLDWAQQPVPYKRYDSTLPIELAAYLPLDPNPFTGAAVDEDIASDGEALGLACLSRLLYLTYGVTGVIPHQPRPLYLRAAPSAGGLYPAECYLVVRAGGALDAGLYGFDPLKHQLAPLWPGDDAAAGLARACYGSAAVAAAPWALVVTAVFERSSWRYGERAYRRVLLDSGHLLGNAALAAPTLGLRGHLTAAFCDDQVSALLRLDSDQEGALAVLALDRAEAPVARPSWSLLPGPVASGEPPLPLLNSLHRAGALPAERPRLVARGEEQAEASAARYGQRGGETLDPGAAPLALAADLFAAIAGRRSTRAFSRDTVTRAQLARIIAAAYAPETCGLGEQPHLARQLVSTFLAVVAVDGLASGLYYLEPHSRQLRLLKDGCDRDAVQYLCLGQELGGDAAVTVFHTADLAKAVTAYGDRVYRSLHLDAGMLGERLDLAALAEGLGASGIGGFFDDHVNGLLGIPAEQAVLYITTIGVPAG